MSKRKRDFTATLEPQLKKHVQGDNIGWLIKACKLLSLSVERFKKTAAVDSFAAMLAASRAQAKRGLTTGCVLECC